MKVKITAALTLVITLVTVFVISFITARRFEELEDRIEGIDTYSKDAPAEIGDAERIFSEARLLFSLSVPSSELYGIAECFSELSTYARLEMSEEGEVTKSRLIALVSRMRRQSWFDFESVI